MGILIGYVRLISKNMKKQRRSHEYRKVSEVFRKLLPM